MNEYKIYYFDAEHGNDRNDGSEKTPFQTLEKATQIAATHKSGNPIKICFRGGCLFEGELLLRYESVEGFPLIVESYGEGQAKFVGGTACITTTNGNVRIQNLELTNPNGIYGIHVLSSEAGACKNIEIYDCYIHDVNFRWNFSKSPRETNPEGLDVASVTPNEVYTHGKGGIIFENDTPKALGASWFDNVRICRNRLECVSRTGMYINNKWSYRVGTPWGYNAYVDDNTNWYPHFHFYIADNLLEYTGGDGIVLTACLHTTIERNKVFHANYLGRTGYFNAGIWPHSSKHVIIRENEVGYTHLDNGAGDGEGFDIDIGCSDITIRDNFSHHNAGGGLLICNNATPLIRYNIDGTYKTDKDGNPITEKIAPYWGRNNVFGNLFVYNGGKDKPAFISLARQCDDFYAHHNTVVLNPEFVGQPIIFMESENVVSSRHLYENNAFYSEIDTGAYFMLEWLKESVFKNNLYFNVQKPERKGGRLE